MKCCSLMEHILSGHIMEHSFYSVLIFTLTAVIYHYVLVSQLVEASAGSKLLGVGYIPSAHNEKLNKFNCPGVGNYPVPENCDQFFHCYFPGHKPTSIFACSGHKMQFHHLSRKCEHASIVDCKFCRNKGILRDKTSKHHFIKCSRGQIADRYKCPEGGRFDLKMMHCQNSLHGMNLTDAVLDPPINLTKFVKKWRKVQLREVVQKSLAGKRKRAISGNGNGKQNHK